MVVVVVGSTYLVGGHVEESLVEHGGSDSGGGSGGGRFAIAEKCTNMGGTVGHDADEQQGTGQSIPQDGEIKDEGVVVQHWAQHLRKEEVVGRGGCGGCVCGQSMVVQIQNCTGSC